MRRAKLLPIIVVCSIVVPCFAINGDFNLRIQKILPPGASAQVTQTGKRAVVLVGNYQLPDRAMRIDAVLMARSIIAAEPSVNCVAVRYDRAGGYTQVLVSAREIISFGAGTMNKDQLFGALQVVSIGAGDSALATSAKYTEVAEASLNKNELDEAQQLFMFALDEARKANVVDARLMNDIIKLSGDMHTKGDFSPAEELLKAAIPVMESHPDVAGGLLPGAYARLADIYIEQKKASDAQQILTRVIDGMNATRDSIEYATAIDKLAGCYKSQDQLAKAVDLYKESLSIKEKLKGETDVTAAGSLEDIADCYAGQSNYAEAIALYKRAHSIFDEAVVSKNKGKRIGYDTYNYNTRRLEDKLSSAQSHMSEANKYSGSRPLR